MKNSGSNPQIQEVLSADANATPETQSGSSASGCRITLPQQNRPGGRESPLCIGLQCAARGDANGRRDHPDRRLTLETRQQDLETRGFDDCVAVQEEERGGGGDLGAVIAGGAESAVAIESNEIDRGAERRGEMAGAVVRRRIVDDDHALHTCRGERRAHGTGGQIPGAVGRDDHVGAGGRHSWASRIRCAAW
jgi:hypothetical protein